MSSQSPQPGSGARGKIGRNERCPCGSGEKFKNCCGRARQGAGAEPPAADPRLQASAPPLDRALATLAVIRVTAPGERLRGLLEQLSRDAQSVVEAFRKTAGESAILALQTLRRGFAQLLLASRSEALAELWPMGLEKVHGLLMSSGVRDLTRSADDEALLARLKPDAAGGAAYQEYAGLLAALMLLVRSFELPIAADLERIPTWIRDSYLRFLVETIEVHNRPGDAERHADYLFELTDLVHQYAIRKCRRAEDAFVRQLCLLYVSRANLIQSYFSTRNLRPLYEQRGDLVAAVLAAGGAQTLCARMPRTRAEPKIRLGIFAQHFAPQTETYFTLAHFDHIDRSRFDITLYTLGLTDHALEKQCIARADRIVVLPTSDLNTQARRIREDDLDILLISTNMSAVTNAAALLGAYRLARIQVASVSSPVTTGGRHMDVLLSAEWNEPADNAQEHYTEHLELLPGSVNYYAFQYDVDPATVAVNLSQLGVPPDSLVMFSGANFFKLIPELSRTWARILAAVPNSVLLLMPFNPNWSDSYKRLPFLTRINEQLREFKVDLARVKVINPVPTRADVQQVLSTAHLYLDAYPFAGACSMLDPIIAGVPPVVRGGPVGRSNHGASLMRMVGLAELISDSEDSYIAAAIDLAADAGKRARLRADLLALSQASPPLYFDTTLFSQRVGDALAGIHARYCSRYARLAGLSRQDLRRELQVLADAVVGRNFELNQLTDVGIVTALVEPFFRALPQPAARHMVDVGACHGAMAAPLLERGWSADLFEPDPDAHAVLVQNTAGWRSLCRIHAMAVSNTGAAEATFHKATQHGLSGLGDSPFAPTQSLIKVPCMGLAEFYEKLKIQAVDFLKIDAEGYDFEALESHDFSAIQPRLVLVEYGTHFARQTVGIVNAAIERMAGLGYGAIVFNYTEDGNFKLGQWIYRLTEMFVDAPIPELGRIAFGNILFYREGDVPFLLTLHALLSSCRRPTEVWGEDLPAASGGVARDGEVVVDHLGDRLRE